MIIISKLDRNVWISIVIIASGFYFFLDDEYRTPPNHQGLMWAEPKGGERVKRNAPTSNLQLLLDRTSSLGRVSNGIILQHGLLNESINLESVIGELLNLGSIQLSDISKFNPESINSFVSSLTEVRSSFGDGKADEVAETKALEFYKIRKDGGTKLEVSKEMKDYFGKVGKIPTEFDLKLVTEVETLINGMSVALEAIVKSPLHRPDGEKLGIAGSFVTIIQGLAKINTEMESVKKLHTHLKTFATLKSGLSILAPFKTILETMKSRDPEIAFATIQANVQRLSDLLSNSKSCTPNIILLRNLINPRLHPHRQLRPFTSGFSNGNSDVFEIQEDLQKDDLKKILNKTNIERLASALLPLSKLPYELKSFDSKFQLNGDMLKSIEQVQMLQMNIQPQKEITKEAIEKVFKFYTNAMSEIPDAVTKPVNDLLAQVDLLAKAITSLVDLTTHLTSDEFKKEIDDFVDSLTFTNIQKPDSDEVDKVLGEIRGNKALENFEKAFKTVQDKLTLATTPDLVAISKTITITPLETFLKTEQVKAELTTQQGLRDLGQDADDVSVAIQSIQSLRTENKNPKSAMDLKTLANLLVDSVKELPDPKSIISKMKSVKTKDSDNLKGDFKAIGDAVFGLQKILDFKNQKMSVEKLKEVDALLKPSRSRRASGTWSTVDPLVNSIKTIEDVDAKLVIPKGMNLTVLGKLFKLLEPISDVIFDAPSQRMALEVEISKTKDANQKTILESGLKSIDDLEVLDLGFSKYKSSFASASGALVSLQNFLTSFLEKVDSSKTSSEASVKNAAVEWIEENAIYVAGSIVVLFICGCGVYGFCRHRKNKKKKEEEERQRLLDEKNEKKTKEQATTTGQTTSTVVDETKGDGNVKEGDKKKEEEVNVEKKADEKVKIEEKQEKVPEEKNKKPSKEKPSKDNGKKDKNKKKSASKSSKGEKPSQEKKDTKDVKKEKPKEVPKKTEPENIVDQLTGLLVEMLATNNTTADMADKVVKQELLDEYAANEDKLVEWGMKQGKSSTDNTFLAAYAKTKTTFLIHFPKFKYAKAMAALPQKKHRNFLLAPQNPIYEPTLPDGGKLSMPIYGHKISGRHEKQIVITQAPTSKDEEHEDTREAFISMLRQLEVKKVGMVCLMKEGGKEACAEYFKEGEGEWVMCGKYKVETMKVDNGFATSDGGFVGANDVFCRKLAIVDMSVENAIPHIVTHYQYIAWPSGGVPSKGPETITEMMKVITAEKGSTAVVHSSLGVGRAMAAAGIILGAWLIEENPDTSEIYDVIDYLYQRCWNRVAFIRQQLFICAALMYKFFSEAKKPKHSKAEMDEKLQEFWSKIDELTNKPEEIKERSVDVRAALVKDTNGLPVKMEWECYLVY